MAFSDWPWFCLHSALARHQVDLSGPVSPSVSPLVVSWCFVWLFLCEVWLPAGASLHWCTPKGMYPKGPASSSSLQPRSGGKGCLCPGSLTPVMFQTHSNRRGEWPPFFCMNRFQLNAAPAMCFMAYASLLSHLYEVYSCGRICWIGRVCQKHSCLRIHYNLRLSEPYEEIKIMYLIVY